MNKIRKLVQKIGLDIHRFGPTPNKLAWFATSGIKTVIDVGANVGQFAKEIRKALPEATIYSFEPIQDCYASLLQNMQGDTLFKAFNVALGDKDETVEIHRSAYSPSSSILEMDDTHKTLFPHTKNSTLEKIEVRRLDDMIEMKPENLQKKILVKIDTQGFEDKVIRGAVSFLRETEVMIVENSYVSLYKGQPLFDDIYKLLTSFGFTYKGALQEKLDPKTGEILFEDSIFLRQ